MSNGSTTSLTDDMEKKPPRLPDDADKKPTSSPPSLAETKKPALEKTLRKYTSGVEAVYYGRVWCVTTTLFCALYGEVGLKGYAE